MKLKFENILHLKYFLIVFLGLLVYSPNVFSQITELQAREMLAERGISEDTLRARLIKKGYNPDNIKPDQLNEFQAILIETVEEIEADMALRLQSQPKPVSPKPVETPPATVVQPIIEPPPAPQPIPIYGQEIFRNNSIAVYQKAEEIIAPDSYVLGVGDRIAVIGFGRSQFEQILEVNADGFVQLGQPNERLPKILLKGIKFGDAKDILYQRYSQYYVISRGEFQVTLNKPRNMTVNVFGEAKTTGSFTLPAINTAFNVISAAGGPTDVGSVRRIKVIRGAESFPLDVYEFMNEPSVAANYFLQNNDYIHIPIAQKVVTIQGAIVRPMSYELLDPENLSQLIEFAGGAKPNAYLSDIKVIRYLEDKKVVTNVNYRELLANGGDYVLYNGDVVVIKTVEESTPNTVRVGGAVVFPDEYERREGMKISDLLQQSILKPEARLDFAYLLRYQPDGSYKYERINLQTILDNPASPMNITLSNQDVLQVMTQKLYMDPASFSVVGAVKTPDTFAFNPEGRIRLEDAILLAGGVLPDAHDFGYIMRYDPKEPKTIEYVQFNLKEAMEFPESTANLEIKAGDHIMVFDKSGRRDELTVSIYGAVRNQGSFPYGPGMTLEDLVSLAGGFTFEADNLRIDLARSEYGVGKDMKITQYSTELHRNYEVDGIPDQSMKLEPFDHVYVRTIPEYEPQQTVYVDGEVRYPGTYPLLQDKERISDIIERAGGLSGSAFPEGAKLLRFGDSTGLVVINLEEILQNNSTPSNIVLRNGDVITIPKSRDLVTINGHVNLDEAYSSKFLSGQRAISVAYRGPKSAKYYIDKFAAGISQTGTSKEIKVQYADGRVEGTSQFLFFNSYPKADKGSIVTVGPKKVKPPVEKSEKKTDWGTVFRDTMYQATAVLTLLILVDELSQ